MARHMPWEAFTAPEPIRPRLRGDNYCNPGEPGDPGKSCTAHPEHHYCETCVGWYGVPHDGIHGQGPWGRSHPGMEADQCACRPCRTYVAWSAKRQEARRG